MWNRRLLHISSSSPSYELYSKKTIFVPFLNNKKVAGLMESLFFPLLLCRAGTDGVKINRGCHNDNVSGFDFCQKLVHIVLLHADAAIAVTGIAAETSGDLLARNLDFLYAASGFLCAEGKFPA